MIVACFTILCKSETQKGDIVSPQPSLKARVPRLLSDGGHFLQARQSIYRLDQEVRSSATCIFRAKSRQSARGPIAAVRVVTIAAARLS